MTGAVLVTGATGTVGRHVATGLTSRGAAVRAPARLGAGGPIRLRGPGDVAALALCDPASHAGRAYVLTLLISAVARAGPAARVTDELSLLLGRPPGSLAQYLHDRRGLWA